MKNYELVLLARGNRTTSDCCHLESNTQSKQLYRQGNGGRVGQASRRSEHDAARCPLRRAN